MRMRMKWTTLLGVALLGLAAWGATAADEPAKADGEPLIVLDSTGKEQKIKAWKITAGTYRILLGSGSRDIRLRGSVTEAAG